MGWDGWNDGKKRHALRNQREKMDTSGRKIPRFQVGSGRHDLRGYLSSFVQTVFDAF